MSSVKDRIRKLQSLDSATNQPSTAPPKGAVASAKQKLTTQTSLPASITSLSRQYSTQQQPPTAPQQSSVSSITRAVESTSLSSTAPRVEQRAAAFAARDAAQESGTSNAAASIIHRLEARNSSNPDEVRDRVRRLEREKPGTLGKGALPASALDQRKAAFERAHVDADGAANLKEKAAAFADAGEDAAGNGTVQTGVFEAKDEEKERAAPTGILDRKGLFERGGDDNSTQEEETQTQKAQAAERVSKLEEQRAREAKQKEEAAAAAAAKAKKQEQATTNAGSNLSQRFAMFESGGVGDAEDKKAKEVVKSWTARDAAPKSVAAQPAKKQTTVSGREPDALMNELEQVKMVNQDLVSRLVELTGAFKRLEKSREELQARVAKLERK